MDCVSLPLWKIFYMIVVEFWDILIGLVIIGKKKDEYS